MPIHELLRREQDVPVVVEQEFRNVGAGGTGHVHQPPVRAVLEQGVVEGFVHFRKFVQSPDLGRQPGHVLDHARKPGDVHGGHGRQRRRHARPFQNAADFVFVLDFLPGHLADEFAFLGFGRDQAVLCENL